MKIKAKSSPPKRKRHILFIAVTEAMHRQIAELAEQNSRTISEEVLTRLRSTLDNATHKEALIREGWVEQHHELLGGTLLFSPDVVKHTLTKIVGTVGATEGTDTLIIRAESMPKKKKEKRRERTAA